MQTTIGIDSEIKKAQFPCRLSILNQNCVTIKMYADDGVRFGCNE